MPARSQSQQRLFGYIHAVQKGSAKTNSPKIKSMAKRVDPQDATDFASTSHKDLPEKVSTDLYKRAALRLVAKAACDNLKRGKIKRGFSKSITKKATMNVNPNSGAANRIPGTAGTPKAMNQQLGGNPTNPMNGILSRVGPAKLNKILLMLKQKQTAVAPKPTPTAPAAAIQPAPTQPMKTVTAMAKHAVARVIVKRAAAKYLAEKRAYGMADLGQTLGNFAGKLPDYAQQAGTFAKGLYDKAPSWVQNALPAAGMGALAGGLYGAGTEGDDEEDDGLMSRLGRAARYGAGGALLGGGAQAAWQNRGAIGNKSKDLYGLLRAKLSTDIPGDTGMADAAQMPLSNAMATQSPQSFNGGMADGQSFMTNSLGF